MSDLNGEERESFEKFSTKQHTSTATTKTDASHTTAQQVDYMQLIS
jgi:hypothetical protein